MSVRRTLSHHLLRRTARAKRAWFRELQAAAIAGNPIAQRVLADYGVHMDSRVWVESTVRGPFGWRVVAK